MRTRSERRHHHQRMIDKVKDFWYLQSDKYWGTEESRQKHIRKVAENRKKCSCHMCRNPRNSDFSKGESKLTMQERRMKDYGADF